jgi:hypothetical protein
MAESPAARPSESEAPAERLAMTERDQVQGLGTAYATLVACQACLPNPGAVPFRKEIVEIEGNAVRCKVCRRILFLPQKWASMSPAARKMMGY